MMRFGLSAFCLVFAASVSTSCRSKRTNSETDAFAENGVVWGFGPLALGPIRTKGRIAVTIDASGSEKKYELRRVLDGSSTSSEMAEIVWADFHPDGKATGKVLGYHYDLKYQARSGTSAALTDIYAVLRRVKGGASFEKVRQIHLGYFADAAAGLAEINLAAELLASEVVSGSRLGRWAIHHKDVPRDLELAKSVDCPEVTSTSGSFSNQTADPEQKYTCRAKAQSEGKCAVDPFADGCLPPEPNNAAAFAFDFETRGEVRGAVKRSRNVFELNETSKQAEVIFVSDKNQSTDGNFCRDHFEAVARTIDNYVHPVCVVQPGPKLDNVDGRAACSVMVTIDSPISYMEKPCNVAAHFRASAKEELQMVQLIKR